MATGNSPVHSSIGTRLVAKGDLPLLVNIRFQVLFHWAFRSSFHLSLAVLVHYRSESIFSLSSRSTQIHSGFHVSWVTWESTTANLSFKYRAITFFGRSFQIFLLLLLNQILWSRNPLILRSKFGLFPFRSPLLRESLLFSFPALN